MRNDEEYPKAKVRVHLAVKTLYWLLRPTARDRQHPDHDRGPGALAEAVSVRPDLQVLAAQLISRHRQRVV